MKPKLLLSVLVPTLVLLIWLAKVGPRTEVAARGGETSEEILTEPAAEANVDSFLTTNSGVRGSNGSDFEDHGAIQHVREEPSQPDECARCGELMELAMNNDSASLDEILRELRSPDSTIRAAALAAVIQFGSREAIPGLIEASLETENGNEKTNILEAIEFLKLPSFSEMISQRPPEVIVPPGAMSAEQ